MFYDGIKQNTANHEPKTNIKHTVDDDKKAGKMFTCITLTSMQTYL